MSVCTDVIITHRYRKIISSWGTGQPTDPEATALAGTYVRKEAVRGNVVTRML